jgi:hypothetical protein
VAGPHRRTLARPPSPGRLPPSGYDPCRQAWSADRDGAAVATRGSRASGDPVRPEEDAGFLPRRDGSDQSRCYGAAEGLTATRASGAERRAGTAGPDPPLRRPGRPRQPVVHRARAADVRFRRPQRRRQDHRHADRAGRAGGRPRRGAVARPTHELRDAPTHRLPARGPRPNVFSTVRSTRGTAAANPLPARPADSTPTNLSTLSLR